MAIYRLQRTYGFLGIGGKSQPQQPMQPQPQQKSGWGKKLLKTGLAVGAVAGTAYAANKGYLGKGMQNVAQTGVRMAQDAKAGAQLAYGDSRKAGGSMLSSVGSAIKTAGGSAMQAAKDVAGNGQMKNAFSQDFAKVRGMFGGNKTTTPTTPAPTTPQQPAAPVQK